MRRYKVLYKIKRQRSMGVNDGGYIVLNVDTNKKSIVDMDRFVSAVKSEEVECINGKVVNSRSSCSYIRTNNGVAELTWSYVSDYYDKLLN